MKTIQTFDGDIQGLILALENPKIAPEKIQSSLKFANETSAKEVHEKFFVGCPKMMEAYKKSAIDFKPFATCGNSYQFANEGLFFDVPTFLSGQPEHWINEVEDFTQTTAKDLNINVGFSWWVKPSDIFNKFKRIIDFIDNCEANGQRLNINIVVFSNPQVNKKRDSSKVYNFKLNIKKANEPINLQQLIYLVCSPIVLRYAEITLLSLHIKGNSYADIDYEKSFLLESDFIYVPSICFDYQNNLIEHDARAERVYYEDMKPINEFYPHLSK